MIILDNLNSGGGQPALATLTNPAPIRLIDQDVVHCRSGGGSSDSAFVHDFCSRSRALSLCLEAFMVGLKRDKPGKRVVSE
jgi:hypothetical protein